MTVSSYHGYFGYNFFDSDAKARPYIFGGLGATSYGGVDYTRRTDGAAGSYQRRDAVLDDVGRRREVLRR